MFEVNNIFHEESLSYGESGKELGERYDEIKNLQEICDYCRRNQEKLECDMDRLYDIIVEPEVNFCDWVYWNAGEADHDIQSIFLYMLQDFTDHGEEKDDSIDISLGARSECVHDEAGYREKRREFLKGLHKVQDFQHFMKSCFINSEFSDNIGHALNKIPDFELHTSEIVENLALLNDYGIKIYKKHKGNEKDAMKELASKALDCSGDPKHKDKLKFPFSYESEENGKKVTYMAEVVCSPHMKLIRRDSDLRIYFYWQDDRISNGEKVLIGRIGGHPY